MNTTQPVPTSRTPLPTYPASIWEGFRQWFTRNFIPRRRVPDNGHEMTRMTPVREQSRTGNTVVGTSYFEREVGGEEAREKGKRYLAYLIGTLVCLLIGVGVGVGVWVAMKDWE